MVTEAGSGGHDERGILLAHMGDNREHRAQLHDGDAARPEAGATTQEKLLRLLAPTLAGSLLLGFLLLRAYALAPHPSDEGIYFYGATRLAAGVWPYRDFFHAHPPLHLLPSAALFAIFGFSLTLAKLPTFLAAAFTGFAVYRVTVTLGPSDRLGVRQAAGAVAAAALLFCESMLKASASDTGICQATAWLALAAWLLTLRRPVSAGLAAAAAPLTLLQAAPPAAVLVAASFLFGRRFGTRTVAAAAGLFVAANGACAALAGAAFWQQVYGFHLHKVGTPGEGAAQLGFIVYDNWVLFALATAGAAALAASGGRNRIFAGVAMAAAVFAMVAMATRPRVFPFYFLPAFFPLALLVGWGGCAMCDPAVSWLSHRRRPALIHALPWALAALLLGPLHAPLSKAVSPKRAHQLATYTQSYAWHDAPHLGALNALVKRLFWQGGVRTVGHEANAVTQYLWQRSRWFEGHGDLVRAVAQAAATGPGSTLFGDSTIAPLVALLAGVGITGDVVDTNMQRLRIGNLKIDDIKMLLSAQPRALLLFGSTGGLGSAPLLRAFAAAHYDVVGQFPYEFGATYTLWRRR